MKIYFYLPFLLILLNCQNQQDDLLFDKSSVPAAPEDWLYEQRAYPFDTIPYAFHNQERTKLYQQLKFQEIEERAFRVGDWQLVGPTNVGGRVTDIALNPNDPNIFFVGTATGGIFKTTDKGQSWKAVFDEVGRLSIGDLTIAPSNTKILYAGTGEANASASSGAFFGDGVYKSENGGKSWTNVGLTESHHIGRVIVNPFNENHVLAAAAGALYKKSTDRGLYQTKDGGETWEQLLFVSDSTSCIDVIMHPQDTNLYYAVTWERLRKPWQRDYAGTTSRIYRTKDGGANWEILNNGLPRNIECGRMGLSIAPSNPNVLYVSITEDEVANSFYGLFKSTNGGDSWRRTNDFLLGGMYSNFGWYFGKTVVAPDNPNRVYVLGVPLYESTNGGNAWERIARDVHVDHHALQMHPKNSNMMVSGNDGGAYLSEDGGKNWTHLKNLPITQFYECEVAQSADEKYYGGTQDNGTLMTDNGGLDNWRRILAGDGFHVIADPENADILYAEYQWGNLFRSTNGGESFQWALSGVDRNDRNNWNTPIAIDPQNSSVLYYGTNRLYRSTNRAASWQVISDDLTKGLHESGSTRYGTLTTVQVSPLNSTIVYVGSDDGNVQMTNDGGVNWTLVSEDLPNRYVTSVVCDLQDAQTAYVTYSGYRKFDYLPHVFRTQDGGVNWEDISGNLPEVPINDLIIDPKHPNTLYVATDLGVWRQKERGENWQLVGKNLPTTVISDLVIHNKKRTLVAATFGRSIHEFPLDFVQPNLPTIDTFPSPLVVHPNPMRSFATVKFKLSKAQKGQVNLYNLNGQLLRTYAEQQFEQGENAVNINLDRYFPTGDYVLTLETMEQKRATVVKVVE